MASKNEIKIMPGATVCESDMSVFRGDLSISTGCVIHPSVQIIAKSGPIILGENCLVEEYATIIYDLGDNETKTEVDEMGNEKRRPVLVIGPNNVFEVGCTIRAKQIGEGNVFECKSKVSERARISNHCVIGAGCYLDDEGLLAEKTVIFGNNACDRRESLEKPGTQKLQLDHLRKVLPNYHHLRKPNVEVPKKVRQAVAS